MLIFLQLKGKWNGKAYAFPQSQIRMLWNGRLAQAKGSTSTTETVPTGPWAGQVPSILQLFGQAQQLYNQGPPQYYPGNTVAPPSDITTATQTQGGQIAADQSVNNGAMQTLLGSAQSAGSNPVSSVGNASIPAILQGIYGSLGARISSGGQNAINAATGASPTQITAPQAVAGGPNLGAELQSSLQGGSLNPYLGQLISTGLRGQNQQFQENVLPGIRSEASAAGQVGGTRQGIAEGIAGRGLADAQGDLITRLLSSDYEAGRAERGNALGLTLQGQLADQGNSLEAQRLQEAIRQGTVGQGLQGAQLEGNLALGQGNLGVQGAQVGGNLLSSGNSQAIQQLLGSLGLLPNIQNSQLQQVGFGNQLGLQQQAQSQAGIDADLEKFFYNEYAPYNALAQFQNFIAGQYGSSVGTGSGYIYPGTYPGTQPGVQPQQYGVSAPNRATAY